MLNTYNPILPSKFSRAGKTRDTHTQASTINLVLITFILKFLALHKLYTTLHIISCSLNYTAVGCQSSRITKLKCKTYRIGVVTKNQQQLPWFQYMMEVRKLVKEYACYTLTEQNTTSALFLNAYIFSRKSHS